MTRRKKGWEKHLIQTIEMSRERSFVWGRNDCCCFVAACVEVMTGQNPMEQFRGRYHDELTAGKALKDIGKGTLYHTLCSIFGRPVSPENAFRGDIDYRVLKTGPAIGICLGKDSVFVGICNNKDGLVTFPTLQAAKIFKV